MQHAQQTSRRPPSATRAPAASPSPSPSPSSAPRSASAQPSIAPPTDRLASQLQRAVSARAPTTALLQRYHRFKSSPGTSYAGYKIVNLVDPTYGRYHVKWHPTESLDAYDELHVKFDDQSWTDAADILHYPYFYFRDNGSIIVGKSSSGRTRLPAAEAVAKQAVDAIIAGSQPVSDQTYAGERAAMLQAKAEHEAEVQAALAAAALVEQQRLAAEAALAEQQRKASEASQDALTHIENFLDDIKANPGERNILRPYIQGPAGAAMTAPWLKGKADWYRAKMANGWLLSLPPIRAPKAPNAAAFRMAAGLTDDVKVSAISKGDRQSSKAWNWNAKADLLNYTLFVKTDAGKAEVAALT
ncbi:MAG: hypothetical protein QOJ63_2858 [Solirubrobacteraceae bacterium]|nr:hypothetical protein [Solirubrobacteraceae bacterium]